MNFNALVYLCIRIGIVGTVYSIASTNVFAQTTSNLSEEIIKDNTTLNFIGDTKKAIPAAVNYAIKANTQTPAANIHQLSDIQLPSTTAKDLLVQSEQTQPSNPESIKVTSVKLKPTSDGLEIILETPNGTLQIADTFNDGDIYIADIANAVLALPEAKEFRADNPAQGITAITVTQFESNNIRVTVTGSFGSPNVKVVNTTNGLTLSLSPLEDDIELLVVAQKRPEDAQNVPLSLTVIPRQELEDSQVDSLIDIANQTPNFNFYPTSAGGTEFSYYSIRGLNNQNFLTAQDSVAFYIDDVPVDYNGFLDLALTDLERVEVLRGPQSTLYGRSSSGGVVNIISREATPEPEVKFAVGYGKYNSRELQFSLNDALVDDKLALWIAGFQKSQDGFIENLATGNTIGE
ncbi:TonB-dependent receptor plug domain-containing protein [Nostoc sp. CCY 9925]|uniref:TonB-dependent receptor plug domain-containing protein n=1 Tax=Nostoc sp. CCY 9925 TaxID=3103865 RepID=UPI0039C7395F